MEPMLPTDAVFLLGESREHPMHVGGLQLFEPPAGAGREFVHELYDKLIAQQDFQPTFRKRPTTLFGGIANLGWTYDKDVDITYHVRRSGLPAPGRVRDLLELTSLLHSSLLDRHRPLWEAHVIEGLEDGRFAMYVKFHHSLIDGVSAVRLMQRSLSDDPDDPEFRAIWSLPKRKRKHEPSSLLGSVMRRAGSIAALVPSTFTVARAALFEQQLRLPFGAPRTMLNVKIGGARRCAAQSWSMDRLKSVKKAAGVTLNDAVLTMCSGALRYYLLEQNALPDKSLIAMVPVSLRRAHEADAGGNLVGAILCNLATDIDDPAKRLEAVSESMHDNKNVFSQLHRVPAIALSAINVSALAGAAIPGWVNSTPPPFNLIISNVPGPREQMYWGGARLSGTYPLSVVLDGLAMNITLVSNADRLDFGLVGCRRSVPHLQRMLLHLESALKDLERAVGV